ncbi:MAG: thioredoxin family protein [Candidatus Marinimicrobia bacterium]|nr:thioredoxin family protein [Candidatus Neomarinimicrobiota bacterium]
MKKTIHQIGILCFLITAFSNAQETIPAAEEIMDIVFQEAKEENKNVFLMFHASWCGWCHRMDDNMQNKACKEFFDANYVITHLTVKENKENKHLENPGALAFLGQLKGEKQGIPYWIIFDKKGTVLENSLDSKGSNLGCPYTKEEVQQFISKLKNTSRLNEEQLDIIRGVFVKKG